MSNRFAPPAGRTGLAPPAQRVGAAPASRWVGAVATRLGMVMATLAVAVVVGAGPAGAHAALLSSEPANGERLARAPAALTLRFNEPVELSLTSLQVEGEGGRQVEAAAPTHAGNDPRSLEARLPTLAPGSYLVRWRTVSADSHPIEGAFAFSVTAAAPGGTPGQGAPDAAGQSGGAAAPGAAGAPGSAGAGADPGAAAPGGGGGPGDPLEARGGEGTAASLGVRAVGPLFTVARLLASAALLTLLGGAAFLAFLRRPAAATRRARRLERRAHQLLLVSWAVGLAATLAGLLLQGPYAAGEPLTAAFRLDLLAKVLPTRFGEVWAARVLLLLLALPLLRAARHPDRPVTREEQLTGGLLGLGLVISAGLSGHAAADTEPALAMVLVDLHFAAVAAWLGGLVLLVASVLPGGHARLHEVVPRFSQLAFGAMVVIVVTGALQSLRAVDGLDALLTSEYGHLLLLKLVAFGVLLAVASISRAWVRARLLPADPVPRRAGPGAALADPAASIGLLRRFVLAEVMVALLILAVTALLANVAHPG
jgi:copper transport protein